MSAKSEGVLTVSRNLACAIGLSLVLFIYERALIPLYGSVPTNYLLNKIALVAVVVSVHQPFALSTTFKTLYATAAFALAPNASYWLAVLTARRGDPVWGPAITHAVVLVPLVFAFILPQSGKASWKAAVLSSSAAILQTRSLWSNLQFLNNVSENQVYLSMSAISSILWILQLDLTPPKTTTKRGTRVSTFTPTQLKSALLVLILSLFWSLHAKLYNPILPHPYPETFTHPSYRMQVHTAVQSTTGLISVGEALPPPKGAKEDDYPIDSVRYLRASHSLLGGVWRHSRIRTIDNSPPLTDSHGHPLGDSIYGVFVLQEIARLVDNTQRGKTREYENALVIGLGAGISATAFMRHNISVSIVEIDSAVYDAARTWFGLPEPGPGKVFLEDAREWAANKHSSVAAGDSQSLYDIVIHDCFSGGGVPEHIYTVEFWSDLKSVVHPDGVVVVNFVGEVLSQSSRMVLHTLENMFGSCRAFHDSMETLTEDKYETEFVNIVFVCTSSSEPPTFREPTYTDYLNSPLRHYVFTTLQQREIDLARVRGGEDEADELLLTDARNPLGKLQEKQGFHHWKLMRQVLPDVFWETY